MSGTTSLLALALLKDPTKTLREMQLAEKERKEKEQLVQKQNKQDLHKQVGQEPTRQEQHLSYTQTSSQHHSKRGR